MKKLISTILTLIFVAYLFVGCNDNSTSNGGFGENLLNTSKTVSVTLIDGETSETVTATYGSILESDPPAKNGYILEGYYDQETGGEKYIGGDGKSAVAWQKGFPTTLYAHWKSIYEITWQSDLLYSKKVGSVGSTNNGGIYQKLNLPAEMRQAILMNPGKEMLVSVSLKAKHTSNASDIMTIRLCDGEGARGEEFASSKNTLGTDYASFSETFTVLASDIGERDLYVHIDNRSTAYLVSMYLKDMSISVKFKQ